MGIVNQTKYFFTFPLVFCPVIFEETDWLLQVTKLLQVNRYNAWCPQNGQTHAKKFVCLTIQWPYRVKLV